MLVKVTFDECNSQADATVSIKEYTTELTFNGVPRTYVKHTYDMNDYLTRVPATANDEIMWASSNTKVAKISEDGVLTCLKVNWDDEKAEYTKEGKCIIYAIGGKDKQIKAVHELKVEAGTPASKVEIGITDAGKWKKLPRYPDPLDLNGADTADVEVKMFATIKGAIKSSTNKKNAAESLDDLKKKKQWKI